MTHSFVLSCLSFFFNPTATTEIYTLSLHDALPISALFCGADLARQPVTGGLRFLRLGFEPQESQATRNRLRSEEHTSELQSLRHLVCRLLLEKKKKIK